jgi:hypothetical protein
VVPCLALGTGAFAAEEHAEEPESLTIHTTANVVEHEAETFTLNPSSAGMVVNNLNASGGQELYL